MARVNLKIYIPVILLILCVLWYLERKDSLTINFNSGAFKDVTVINPGKGQFHFKTSKKFLRLKGVDEGDYVVRVTFEDGAKCTEHYTHESSWKFGTVEIKNPECSRVTFRAPGATGKKKEERRRGNANAAFE